MRAFMLFFATFVVGIPFAVAQQFGYIDSDYVLGKLPEYGKMQDEIDRLSVSWQQEIESMQDSVRKSYRDFETEKVLLTEQMKAERLERIHKKEAAVRAYQKKVFGFDGLFFLKKKELIKPLQDRVFEAVKKVAKTKSLAVVFDKSGDLVMMYTDPTYDYTDFVLEELGLGDPVDTIE